MYTPGLACRGSGVVRSGTAESSPHVGRIHARGVPLIILEEGIAA